MATKRLIQKEIVKKIENSYPAGNARESREGDSEDNDYIDFDDNDTESNVINVNVGSQQSDKPQTPCSQKKECCCYFDVYLARVQVVKQVKIDGMAELMFTAYANGIAGLVPGMGAWMCLHEKWGWSNVYKFIHRFAVSPCSKMEVLCALDAIEAGGLGEGNWEMGSSQGGVIMELKCNKVTTNAIVSVQCHKVKKPVQDTVTCIVQGEFIAVPVNDINCCKECEPKQPK